MGDGPSAFIPRLTYRDSIELVAASATLPGITVFGTLPLETFGEGIVEGCSTEIEHSLLSAVTLHEAEDGIHWFCHEILPELNVSPSERLAIRRDI